MVFIHVLYKHICEYITTQKIPNNLINISKQGLLDYIGKYLKAIEFDHGNIRAINLSNNSWIDLSKLEHLSKFINVFKYQNWYFLYEFLI